MNKHSEVIRESVKLYGKTKQSVVCMEECSELIQSISKVIRKGETDELLDHLAEEMADVYICLEMLSDMYSIPHEVVNEYIEYKIDRQNTRNAEVKQCSKCV